MSLLILPKRHRFPVAIISQSVLLYHRFNHNLRDVSEQLALQEEMEAHLTEKSLEDGTNSRNGLTSKTMKSATGSLDLEVPRDRNSTFEPQLIKKRQTVLTDELDSKILALYSLGISYEGITSHLQDIYGVSVSAGTISSITDKVLPQITEWRNRPLESIYAIVFLDAMFFKTKQDNKVVTKVIYDIMGINRHGHKDILGFYACVTYLCYP